MTPHQFHDFFVNSAERASGGVSEMTLLGSRVVALHSAPRAPRVGDMVIATVDLELPRVDAVGAKTVVNPVGNITLVASDVKTRGGRLGLRKQQAVRCPITGLTVESNGTTDALNEDKRAHALARSRRVYARARHDLIIQAVRKANLVTENTNEKRVRSGPAAKSPFER